MKFSKYQMDVIEENVRLYDCMRASEKQFIQEVMKHHTHTYIIMWYIHPCMDVVVSLPLKGEGADVRHVQESIHAERAAQRKGCCSEHALGGC